MGFRSLGPGAFKRLRVSGSEGLLFLGGVEGTGLGLQTFWGLGFRSLETFVWFRCLEALGLGL